MAAADARVADGYAIREARASDVPAIERMTRAVYGGCDYVRWALDFWLAGGAACGVVLVAELVESGLAVAIERMTLLDGGRTAWLEALRVDEAHRRRGLASALKAELLRRAWATPGVERVRCSTSSQQRTSLGLSERLGIVPSGVRMCVFLVDPEMLEAVVSRASAAAGPAAGAAARVAESTDDAEVIALVRGDGLVVDWKVLEPRAESLRYVREQGHLPLLARVMPPADASGTAARPSLSLVTSRPNHAGTARVTSATVYADTSAELMAHIALVARDALASDGPLMITYETRHAGAVDESGLLRGNSSEVGSRELLLLEQTRAQAASK